MLQRLMYFYGFRAELLEHGPLYQLFPRGQQGDLRWAAQACQARACEHQSDHFGLYWLPELEIFLMAFSLDGDWIRIFEERPNLMDVARCLRQTLTGVTLASRTPYIPSGSLDSGWDKLEQTARLWWWVRLRNNLQAPTADLEDWPQRWADLLHTLD